MLKYINTTHGLIVFSPEINHSDFKNIVDAGIESAGSFVTMPTADGTLRVALSSEGSPILGVSSNPEKDRADLEHFVNNLSNGD